MSLRREEGRRMKDPKTLEALHQLKKIMQKTKNKRVYATVLHVSAFDMSRVIKFIAITKNGDVYNLNNIIHNITGYAHDRNYYGLRVYGSGMDMIFNTLYNVNAYAIDYKVIKTSKNKTKHDLYYNGVVDTNYWNI